MTTGWDDWASEAPNRCQRAEELGLMSITLDEFDHERPTELETTENSNSSDSHKMGGTCELLLCERVYLSLQEISVENSAADRNPQEAA